jgi:hypothetical protein
MRPDNLRANPETAWDLSDTALPTSENRLAREQTSLNKDVIKLAQDADLKEKFDFDRSRREAWRSLLVTITDCIRTEPAS